MKYTKRKTPAVSSLAAAEVKALLETQDPPLGSIAAAALIGLHYETMRSVVNDSRVPSTGVIYGLARVLKTDETWVQKVLDLRRNDLFHKKVNKMIKSGSGQESKEALAILLDALNEDQINELKNSAIKFAEANKGDRLPLAGQAK